MIRYPNVNSPIKISGLQLKNRLVFAPMVTNLANPDGTVSDELIEFVRARARGGAGLVITENTAVNQTGRLFCNTRIDKDEFIPGLARLFNAVHQEGAKVLIQLDHAGRETTPQASQGLGPVSPSPFPSPTFKITPRQMSLQEIEQTIADFVSAALRAQKALADGVELQAAHGFLLHQFLSPRLNHRTDAYGGDLQGRTRFLIKIIKQIRKNAGNRFLVCCRISAEEYVPGGLTLQDSIQIAKRLENAGVDLIHISAGVLEVVEQICPTQDFPDAPHSHLFDAIRRAVKIPVIAVGKIPGLDAAEKLLAEEKADLVAFARPLLADPELINKELSGRAHEVVGCIWCNSCFSQIVSPEPKIACILHKKNQEVKENESFALARKRKF